MPIPERDDRDKPQSGRAFLRTGAEDIDFAFAYHLSTPIWVFDIDRSRVVMANAAACEVWEAGDEAELCARDMGRDMTTTVRNRLRQYQADFERGAIFHEMWTLYPNGRPTNLKVVFHGYRMADGRMAMLCEGASRADDAPENLRSAEALLHTDVLIGLFRRDGPALYLNPAARHVAANVGLCLPDLFVQREDYDALMFELDDKAEHSVMVRLLTGEGPRWHNVSAKLCSDAVTGDPAILVTSRDVTEMKEARDHARFLADRDMLTGCFNRAYLQQRIETLEKGNAEKCALVYFDIDRFKQINDRFGHEMGDIVLKCVVTRTRSAMRESDVLARLGGDEFVLLIENSPPEDELSEAVRRISEELSRPVVHQSIRVSPTISVGIAFFTPGETSFTQVLREADIALYASKAKGRNRATVFNEELGQAARLRDRLEMELKGAIENREFVLHYQPRIDLVRRRVVAVEGLVRWVHPERGLVPPNEFIPVCEETGMIEDLGRLVLEEGCRQAIAWHREGLRIGVSLNLSPRQFNDKSLMSALRHHASEPGFPAGRIELEITENVLIGDRNLIAEKLQKINEMGYLIAVDDFGVGYSNLSYISRFPLECIKIDSSFIRQLPNSGPVVRLILTLAKQIGAVSVAEGVETEDECRWLAEQGCDQVQGFFFARPEPLEAVRETIARINDARV